MTASPELFLRRDGDVVESGPIKGTAPTAAGLTDKDRAENVMIVDLVRNDLGAVAETGSVEVPALNAVEEHPGLVHLVSTVRARLRPDAGWPDLLAATFPPGSVTGAPKSSALAAIGELEADAPRPVLRGGRLGGRRPRACHPGRRHPHVLVAGRPAAPRHRRRHHLGVGRRGGVGRDRAEGPAAARRGRSRCEMDEDGAMKVWLDGAVLEPDAARVSVFDHGLTVGDGVFETAKVLDGVPFALTRHLDRLAVSARGLGLEPPDDDVLRGAVAETLAANAEHLGSPLRLRITLTGGTGPLGSDRGDAGPTPGGRAGPDGLLGADGEGASSCRGPATSGPPPPA